MNNFKEKAIGIFHKGKDRVAGFTDNMDNDTKKQVKQVMLGAMLGAALTSMSGCDRTPLIQKNNNTHSSDIPLRECYSLDGREEALKNIYSLTTIGEIYNKEFSSNEELFEATMNDKSLKNIRLSLIQNGLKLPKNLDEKKQLISEFIDDTNGFNETVLESADMVKFNDREDILYFLKDGQVIKYLSRWHMYDVSDKTDNSLQDYDPDFYKSILKEIKEDTPLAIITKKQRECDKVLEYTEIKDELHSYTKELFGENADQIVDAYNIPTDISREDAIARGKKAFDALIPSYKIAKQKQEEFQKQYNITDNQATKIMQDRILFFKFNPEYIPQEIDGLSTFYNRIYIDDTSHTVEYYNSFRELAEAEDLEWYDLSKNIIHFLTKKQVTDAEMDILIKEVYERLNHINSIVCGEDFIYHGNNEFDSIIINLKGRYPLGRKLLQYSVEEMKTSPLMEQINDAKDKNNEIYGYFSKMAEQYPNITFSRLENNPHEYNYYENNYYTIHNGNQHFIIPQYTINNEGIINEVHQENKKFLNPEIFKKWAENDSENER